MPCACVTERAEYSPRVRSLVNLEVLRAREDFAAACERTGERLLTGMHTNMIDQFVLRLKRTAMPRTIEP